MERICFVLQVKPDRLEEYKERHWRVWPQMLTALRETGMTVFSSDIWKRKISNERAPAWHDVR